MTRRLRQMSPALRRLELAQREGEKRRRLELARRLEAKLAKLGWYGADFAITREQCRRWLPPSGRDTTTTMRVETRVLYEVIAKCVDAYLNGTEIPENGTKIPEPRTKKAAFSWAGEAFGVSVETVRTAHELFGRRRRP